MKQSNNGLTYLKRIKSNVPFSQRLNDWIVNRVAGIKFVPYNGEELSFEEFKQEYAKNGYMYISTENCEDSIFGKSHINVLFRVWHDSIHIELNEDFDYMAEARVAFKQCAELPSDWLFEKQLIMCEVIAQASYHQKTGNFVANQREFTINVLETGKI